MHLTWKNIDKAILKELDSWIRLDDNIKKYAMFDYSFTSYEKILKENKIDGESYITKIVYVDNILLGYLALCYFQWNGKNVISINPIVINPKYHNNGYGKLILNDLIKNNKKIIDKIQNPWYYITIRRRQ